MNPPNQDARAFPHELDAAEQAVWRRVRASQRLSPSNGGMNLAFQALGSPCRVWWAEPPAKVTTTAEAVVRWVAQFEARYSRFIPTSLVNRINDAAGREWVQIDPELERMLALCQEMHFITRGTFDPTALPLVRLWDWKANPPKAPEDTAIDASRKLVGWRKVQRAPGRVFLPEPGMALDLGGMGKEYAVDQVTQLISEMGATSGLVDFGADVRVFGPPPLGKPAWHIGLEDAALPGQCWTGLAVNEQAVATSGDYRRHFVANGRRYGHILDVRTGRPVDNGCRAVSVIAPSCSLAGTLSTAAFVLGAQEGLRLLEATPQAEGCIMTDDVKFPSRRFHEFTTR